MPLLPTPILDYTDRDFDSIRLRLQALIRSVFPDWTDFNVANFGDILLELYAFTGDLLGFYQDNQAQDSRIVTATQRKNIIALVKLINYRPRGASAAQAVETFTLKAAMAGTVTLPPETAVKTADITSPILFRLLAPLVFAPGVTTLNGTVEASEAQSDVFISTGLPNQSFVLSATPYLDQSAVVAAGNGPYSQVENFLDSIATDRHYTLSTDQNSKATISFGNGVQGAIPTGTVGATYRTGGGLAGNVDVGQIKILEGSFTDSFGSPASISVTNAAKASGGLEQETNAQVKVNAPASLRVLTRAVAKEDFEIVATGRAQNATPSPTPRVTGIARALMTTSNEDPAVPENTGDLYVVPLAGGAPSQPLKDLVRAQFISSVPGVTPPFPSTLTFRVNVLDPLYLTINVYATVFFRAGVVPAAGAKAIRDNLAAFFAISLPDGTPNPTIDFGDNFRDANGNPIGSIALSDVFDVVKDTPQVLRIEGRPSDFLLNGGHNDVPILVREFPRLGTVSLVDGLTGLVV